MGSGVRREQIAANGLLATVHGGCGSRTPHGASPAVAKMTLNTYSTVWPAGSAETVETVAARNRFNGLAAEIAELPGF